MQAQNIIMVRFLISIALTAEVTLTSVIKVNEPVNIVGNSDQLYRLVSNLIINAINSTRL